MTDRSRARTRAVALTLIPLSAGVLGASVSWAGSRDPLADGSVASASTVSASTVSASTAGTAAEGAPTAGTSSVSAASDADEQRVAELTAQVTAVQVRIAALQATLAERTTTSTDAAGARAVPPSAGGLAPAGSAGSAAPEPAPVPAPAPAPEPVAQPAAPAPPVDVVTKASG